MRKTFFSIRNLKWMALGLFVASFIVQPGNAIFWPLLTGINAIEGHQYFLIVLYEYSIIGNVIFLMCIVQRFKKRFFPLFVALGVIVQCMIPFYMDKSSAWSYFFDLDHAFYMLWIMSYLTMLAWLFLERNASDKKLAIVH